MSSGVLKSVLALSNCTLRRKGSI